VWGKAQRQQWWSLSPGRGQSGVGTDWWGSRRICLIFLFFPKMFAESQILHMAREPEEWLMARNPLPTEFGRECFAGGYSRQSFCLVGQPTNLFDFFILSKNVCRESNITHGP
jgi:hypothetical protein